MRILFMGTPDIAAASLQALLDAGHEVCAVFTRRDKPVGRKQILTAPPVTSREVASELPFACPMLSAPSDEKLIIGMMKKMQVVVSMRLHALIFASSVAAPLVAVSYDPKVTGFMHYIGQKHCVYFEDVTAENLCALIDGALGDTGSYSVERLRTLAAQNEEIAKKLLEEDR